ncbi:unnamed protein product [Vicia faba]|uniref:Uncharacterized protein n=1 Tax=Vicia faba TaxID=3906 RepID=A0AAV0ZAY0_VICFA|nr:unnamed protein product [Vicia faba]
MTWSLCSVKMENFPHNNDERMLEEMCLYLKRIGLERKMSIEVLTFEEVVERLEKLWVTDMNNLVMSNSNDNVDNNKSSLDQCLPPINNIKYMIHKEKFCVILSSNEARYTSAGSNGKVLIWMNTSLNMNQNQAGASKLVQEIDASNEVIDILELWLNKAKEAQEVKNKILVVEPDDGKGYKKILIKNMTLKI